MSALNIPFSSKEDSDMIKWLPHNKPPGPDWFSAEYFKLFFPFLPPYLEKLYNSSVYSKLCLSEILNATIVALPQPGKDLALAQNFHSILFVKYKLEYICKVSIYLPEFINPDQGFDQD